MRGIPRNPEIVDFDRYRTAHPLLREAESRLLSAIREPGDSVIVLLAGPSGVGKTTLLKSAVRTLRAELMPNVAEGDDPVRSFTMPPFGPNGFSLKDLYVAILQALDEPGIEDKVEYEVPGHDQTWPIRQHRATESALRGSCVEALGRRGVLVLFGDEAQHLCEAGGTAHIRSLLESIKWLGLATEVLIVLAGTYDLRALIGLNPQLDRRTQVVHFRRYRKEVPEDRAAFVNVLRNFESHLPGVPPDLAANEGVLFDRSNGCVGYLKNRLVVCLTAALSAGRDITMDDLAPDQSERRALALHRADIVRGEADFSTEKGVEAAPVGETARRVTGPPVGEALTEILGSARAVAAASPRPRQPFRTKGRSPTGRSRPAASSDSGAA